MDGEMIVTVGDNRDQLRRHQTQGLCEHAQRRGRLFPAPTTSPAPAVTDDYHVKINKAAGIARQVWREFSPRDGEELACRDDGTFEVTIPGEGTEGFDIEPDRPTGSFAAALADRLQTIFMEIRQQMIPGCPIHPGAHPLHSDVVNGAAAWVCPSTQHLVRFIRVTGEAV